jgi:histidinol phosphatase-like enzyme (inositol monophosphatase family)
VSDADLQERLDAALAATRLAATETLRWFHEGGFRVERKADASPVTEADRAAEAILRGGLLGAFPEDAFLGEETGETPGVSGYEWVVDPIDGTKSFIHGVPLYSTLVACRKAGRGLVGVIAVPALGELAYARAGGGAWFVRGDAEPVRAAVSSRREMAESLVCSSDFVDFADWSGGAVAGRAARDRIEADAGLTRTWGDGYGYLLVATGRAEVMIDPRMNAWDAAAVAVVVREAGGRFSDWLGRDRIDSGCGLATNGLLHGRVLELLREQAVDNQPAARHG